MSSQRWQQRQRRNVPASGKLQDAPETHLEEDSATLAAPMEHHALRLPGLVLRLCSTTTGGVSPPKEQPHCPLVRASGRVTPRPQTLGTHDAATTFKAVEIQNPQFQHKALMIIGGGRGHTQGLPWIDTADRKSRQASAGSTNWPGGNHLLLCAAALGLRTSSPCSSASRELLMPGTMAPFR